MDPIINDQGDMLIPAPNTCHLLCDLKYALTVYTTWDKTDDAGGFSPGLIWQTKSGSHIVDTNVDYVGANEIRCWERREGL